MAAISLSVVLGGQILATLNTLLSMHFSITFQATQESLRIFSIDTKEETLYNSIKQLQDLKLHGLSHAMVTKLWPSETSEGSATLRATQST
jgi:hypothetical protein